ncbi:hypothetical protein BGZ73_005923 [Actinomortierella ambigua]|nr:hypothetical protein BGZ73_005923 [Actinomortierella ambigua]
MVRPKTAEPTAKAARDQAAALAEVGRQSAEPACTSALITENEAASATPAYTSATTGTQATMDKFLSRMLAKREPGPAKVQPKAKTMPASNTSMATSRSTGGEDAALISASSSAPPPAISSSISLTPAAAAVAAASTIAPNSTTTADSPKSCTPPPTSASPEAKKDSRDKKAKGRPKETMTSTMEALRGARRKPLPESLTKESESPHDGRAAGAGGEDSWGNLSNHSAMTSRSTTSPPPATRSNPVSKEHSIIYLSSQPSYPLQEEEQHHVVYTIDSTQPDENSSSIDVLSHPGPAPSAKENAELGDSLASHIPSVNHSVISRWIGDVAEETSTHQRMEKDQSDNDDGTVQETQQPPTETANSISSSPPTKPRSHVQPGHSIVLTSSPILIREDSGLPLQIATPTPKATTRNTAGERPGKGANSSTSRPGTRVLVPDSLPPMPTWMHSLPEDDEDDDAGDQDLGNVNDSQYHQPWQSLPEDYEGPTPSSLDSGAVFQDMPERISASPTGSPVLSSPPAVQPPVPDMADEGVDVSPRGGTKSRPTTHGLPAGLTSSFLEELGVRADELALRQSAPSQGQDPADVEAEDEKTSEGYHRRKRTKRGGRTEELMYEMEHPRHELPLDMTGAAQNSHNHFDNSASLHMAQRDMFPSTLGSLPLSTLSYESSQELQSRPGPSGISDRIGEVDWQEGNARAGAGSSSSNAPPKRRISGGHLGSASSKSTGTSSMISLPSPPSLNFDENVSASYVDELAAIAEQISDHESHE